jgi:hypothetical protein
MIPAERREACGEHGFRSMICDFGVPIRSDSGSARLRANIRLMLQRIATRFHSPLKETLIYL